MGDKGTNVALTYQGFRDIRRASSFDEQFLMTSFMFRCPRTGQKIEGHTPDNLIEGEEYVPVTCTACGGTHLVNPKTGKLLEPEKKQ